MKKLREFEEYRSLLDTYLTYLTVRLLTDDDMLRFFLKIPRPAAISCPDFHSRITTNHPYSWIMSTTAAGQSGSAHPFVRRIARDHCLISSESRRLRSGRSHIAARRFEAIRNPLQ